MEQLENEECLPATSEKKRNSTELLESNQHKSDWEGNEDLCIAPLGAATLLHKKAVRLMGLT